MIGLNRRWLRRSDAYMRCVAWVVLVSFTTVTVSPGAQAIAQTIDEAVHRPDEAAIEGVDKNDGHSAIIERLKHRVESLRSAASTEDAGDLIAEVKKMGADLIASDEQIRSDFAAIETHIRSNNLPAVIFERQKQAELEFESASNELRGILESQGMRQRTPEALESLHKRLQRMRTKRVHQTFDPEHLPLRAPQKVTKPPRLSSQEFADTLIPEAQPDVLLASNSVNMILGAQLAPIGAEYLAATEDVQITDAVRALAQDLANDPVKIFAWVRNNIQYLPTYGSMQGSAMTLVSKQGNAFDTASLLIALLRAAGIPSRYVYGTVEMPIAAVLNLAGNLASPQAALDLLAQGGIPVTGLAQGGTIRAARLEHVWVEAFVDFQPSRGAKHRQGDTWVPMDASFKTYAYTEGMQLNTRLAYSAERLLSDARQNATLNTAEGWSSGLNHQFVTDTVSQYRNSAESYVNSIDDDATVDEILGGKSIVQQNPPVLAGSLPYKKVAEGFRSASLPASMRAELRVEFFNNTFAQQSDSPEFVFRRSMPELAGKRITMSYDPATPADRTLLESFANSAAPIPAYLVRVQPVLRIDGVAVARGGAAVLGSDQAWNIYLRAPNAELLSARNSIVAGTYTAVVSKLTTIMPQQFAEIEQRARESLEAVHNGNAAAVATDSIVGEFLNVAGLGYWAQQDLVGRLMARAQQIQRVNRFALGLFAWEPIVQYSYGLPRTATAGGFSTDIDINLAAFASSDGRQERVAIARMMEGQLSSHLEGAHWALARNRRDDPNTGFSSSQIFQQLSAQGARTYAVTQENVQTVLSRLPIAEAVKADIRAGVNAGLVGFVNDQMASLDGWRGTGYMIVDPETGAGAYRINGGLNGGGESCQCFNVSLTQEFLLVMGVTFAGVVNATAGAVLSTILAVALSYNSLCQIDNNPCLSEEARYFLRGLVYLSFFFSAVGVAMGLVGFFTFGVGLVVAAMMTMFMNYLSLALSWISTALANGVLNNCRS